MNRTCMGVCLAFACIAALFVSSEISALPLSAALQPIVHAQLIESRTVDALTLLTEIEAEIAANVAQNDAYRNEAIVEIARKEAHQRIKELGANAPLVQFSSFVLTARDGTNLWTRVYVPADISVKYSTTMARSPYGPTTSLLAFLFVLDGHAGVSQDIRGTGKSTGYFDVWRQDGKDGYDTMSWITSQSWSNGQVFSLGASADGCSAWTQWLESPTWLKGQWLIWYASNSYPTVYPGGAYRANLIDKWMAGVCPECIADIKANEAQTSYWDPITAAGKYHMVTGSTVHWGGWYDIFAEPTIEGFNGAQESGAADVRNNNFLVMDVGGHCFSTYHRGGRSSLPIRLPFNLFHFTRDNLTYADTARTIKSKLGIEAINLFVMGPDVLLSTGNYWTSIPTWPRVTELNYYLQSGNLLSTSSPVSGSSATFSYDPANPVPTIGGNELFGGCGPMDQKSIESRSDVLIFTSDVLRSNVPITGLVKAILYVSSDAIDTDFTVKLTDVHPDGRSLLLIDNVIRMRWRESNTEPVNMSPGRVYQVEVKVGYLSYIFNRGHQIRVAISSSNYPRFSANPNNGYPIKDDSGPVIVARNTVYFDRSNPSRLVLPGVNIADIPQNANLRDMSF
eukprot:TRINITY_DN604_c0_g1_i1.p1 TRINITY_DN604_c0_g1~~TRINITY_DN604_c0_g1_i1.p1  ORF type:complete len:622 (-),score=123.44 TRINITY_DN604_c0_g1_i1:231-2096(-)